MIAKIIHAGMVTLRISFTSCEFLSHDRLIVNPFHRQGETARGGHGYPYGRIVEWRHVNGKLEVTTRKVDEFRYQGKVIEAGFFELPGAENMSAVLFSNAGTIAKFDRIGVLAGYAAAGHRYEQVASRATRSAARRIATPKEFKVLASAGA